MKTKPNDSIAPTKGTHGPAGSFPSTYGLTKREYFAAMAMQGLASRQLGYEDASEDAVEFADALIAALNEPKEAADE